MTNDKIQRFEDIPESYQEYIETIYRIYLKQKDSSTDEIVSVSNRSISEALQIKPSSVTNMLRKLADKGLIEWKPRNKNIHLTKLGKNIAKRILYNHILMGLFLKNALGIDDDELVHKYACELEHHMDQPLFDAFKNMMGKKTSKLIQEHIDQELVPDKIHKQEIFSLTPKSIIDNFVKRLIKQIPDSKDDIIKEKEKYLNEF